MLRVRIFASLQIFRRHSSRGCVHTTRRCVASLIPVPANFRDVLCCKQTYRGISRVVEVAAAAVAVAVHFFKLKNTCCLLDSREIHRTNAYPADRSVT